LLLLLLLLLLLSLLLLGASRRKYLDNCCKNLVAAEPKVLNINLGLIQSAGLRATSA
jgi:hypothetical protein